MIITQDQIDEMEAITVRAFGRGGATEWWITPHEKMGWARPAHYILAEGGDQRVFDFIKRAAATEHVADALRSDV